MPTVVSEPVAHEQAATRYAFVYGVRRTHETLGDWQARPLAGAAAAGSPAASLPPSRCSAATWLIAGVSGAGGFIVQTIAPPFARRQPGPASA